MVLSSIAPDSIAADLSDEECDVSTGQSIQTAIDQADPYTRIVVCEATYEESLVIDKDGIQLLGKGTPVLDGTVLGQTHGITLAEGVRDVKIYSFEIQNFDAELSDDPSSGIASEGSTYNVTLEANDIHDNAWAGVLAADGHDIRWTIQDNRFDFHGFAHVFLQSVLGADVVTNDLASSDQGMILADTRIGDIENNTIHGGGNGAIAITPGLVSTDRSKRLDVSNNTIDGQWTHGIWMLHNVETTLEHNNISINGTGITTGTDPANVTVNYTNEASTGATDLAYANALETFAQGPDDPPQANTTLSTVSCDLTTDCSPNVLDELFDQALQEDMHPLADEENANDAEKLSLCAGQSADCFRDAFFRDDAEPQNWTVQVFSDSRLEFLDAGIRRPGEDKGEHTYTDDLEGNWTPMVLCRLVVNETHYPCQGIPNRFEFGLNIKHSGHETPRHDSEWRLWNPAWGHHDRFQRIHGPDATLFKKTTEAHSNGGAPPEDVLVPNELETQERNGEEAAGFLQLGCLIMPFYPINEDCGGPTLAREALDPGLAYCPSTQTDHEATVHQTLGAEARALWRWSQTCRDLDEPERLSWDKLLSQKERTELANEHEQYYAATTDTDRQQHLDGARHVLSQALARRLALQIDGHGMPTHPNDTLLANATPTKLDVGHPGEGYYVGSGPAVTHDDTIYVFDLEYCPNFICFGFFTRQYYRDSVWAIDLDTHETRLLEDRFPNSLVRPSAVSTGDAIYIFNRKEIYRFNPITETVTELNVILPGDARGSVAAWDSRDRPWDGCPNGCAYIFGASDKVLQFNPTLGQVQETDLHSKNYPMQAVSGDGGGIYLLWERVGQSETKHFLNRYTPQFGIEALGEVDKGRGAGLAWHDGRAYVLGGSGSDNVPTNEIRMWNSNTGTFETLNQTLPEAVAWAASTQTSDTAYTLTDSATQRFKVPVTADTQDHELAEASKNYTIVDLQAEPIETPNVELANVEVLDNGTWRGLQKGPLVAYTPARLTANITYETVNGSTIEETIRFLLHERDPKMNNASAVRYGNTTYASVTSLEPNNRHFSNDYQIPTLDKIGRTIPLLNVTHANTTSQDRGLFDAGMAVDNDVTQLTTCVEELYTAAAGGLKTNLDPTTHEGPERLAIEGSQVCKTPSLETITLRLQNPMALSLVVREGSQLEAKLSVVDDPTEHLTNESDPQLGRNLSTARSVHTPSALEKAVEPASGRIVVTLPSTYTKAEQALVISTLINAFEGHIGVFAVAIDGLPKPPVLTEAINGAVLGHGATVLAGAGTLPSEAANWRLENKLMTIHGLAAHPLVLTIGAGDNQTGIAPESRRGPSITQMGPKPDLVAPSPGDTTAGAVLHVLPFVEALAAKGLHETNVLRTALAGYAQPVATQAQTPATFYSQGLGAIDLGAFLDLPDATTLLNDYRKRHGLTWTEANETLATHLGTDVGAIEAASPRELVAATEQPGPLVRAAVSGTLVNLTLNAPALPHTGIADYGVVNHNKTARAYVGAVDLDPLVNATVNSTRVFLENAGYTGTELDETLEELTRLFSSVVERRQDVTINVTHYYFPSMLNSDYLYTLAHRMLEQTQTDLGDGLPDGATPEGIQTVEDRLDEWLLEPHHLVRETHGEAHVPTEVDWTCAFAPVKGMLEFGDASINLLHDEARRLSGSTAGPAAAEIASGLPDDATSFFQATGGTVESQGQDRSCISVQISLLTVLKNATENLRDAASEPRGEWIQTEAETGAWNKTPLGHQIENTTEILDVDPGALATNNTLVLDILLEAIARSLTFLEEKLDSLAIPRIEAKGPRANPPETFYPETIRERTNNTEEHPLGGYTGLARITSHGLNVTNPFTGNETERRNITIPIPSLLWNNPTLHWNEQYRDLTPLPNASVGLTELMPEKPRTLSAEDPPVRIPPIKERNTTIEVGDVNISVAANATLRWSPDQQLAANLSKHLSNLTTNESLHPHLAPVNDRFKDVLGKTNESVDDWLDGLECATNATCEALDEIGLSLDNRIMSTLLSNAYSHSRGHRNQTEEDGSTGFHYVFPGAYKLDLPYPYPSIADLDRDYNYTAPGTDWFAGGLNPTESQLHRQAHHVAQGWAEHPSVDRDKDTGPQPIIPEEVENATNRTDYLPFVEVHGEVFSLLPFRYAITGPDLPGFGCLDALRFTDVTQTPLTFPGCGEIPIPEELREQLRELRGVIRCVLDRPHTGLTDLQNDACQTLHHHFQRVVRDCDTNATEASDPRCQNKREILNLTENLTAMEEDLSHVLGANTEAFFPFARSPNRTLAQNRTELGLVPENQINRTDRLNPDIPKKDLWPDLNDTIQNITDFIGPGNFTVDTPKKHEQKTHDVAQGIVHHATDRISGLDWLHLGTNRVDPDVINVTVQDVEGVVETVTNWTLSPDDSEALGDFKAQLRETKNITAAFERGLAQSRESTAGYLEEGWRPNGTVTLEGYQLKGDQVDSKTRSATSVCEDLEATQGVPESYFEPCDAIASELGPESQTFAGVDPVGFANTLLEKIRLRPEQYKNGEVPGEVVRDHLEQAVALSAVDINNSVRRSEETFLVESNTTEIPAAGLMLYSTPAPIQEHIRYRLDGQILLENTAALVVTTESPLITETLITANEAFDDNNSASPANAVGTVLTAISEAVGSSAQDPLVRAELLGFPYQLEARAGTPEILTFDEPGTAPPCIDPQAPEDADSNLCTRGLFTARPDGFHNYTVTHEMNTLHRGPDIWGPRQLTTLIVYFPMLGEGDPLKQTVGFHNMSLQMTTYLGIKGATLKEDGTTKFPLTSPIRYRANVEDFKQRWAVPDAPLKSAGSGLDLEFSMNNSTHEETVTFSEKSMYREGVKAPSNFTSYCPKTNVPGWDVGDTFSQLPRGVGDEAWISLNPLLNPTPAFAAKAQACERNTMRSLRPAHVAADEAGCAVMTQNPKRISDSLQYRINLGHTEAYSEVDAWGGGGGVSVNPLNGLLAVADPVHPGLSTGTPGVDSDAVPLVADRLARWDPDLPSLNDLEGPILNLEKVLPYAEASWIQKSQSSCWEISGGDKVPLPIHNDAILAEEDAYRLLNKTGNLWNPQAKLHRSEQTEHASADETIEGLEIPVEGHRLPHRNRTHEESAVLAFDVSVDLDGTDGPGQANTIGRLFLGNGRTGVGTALEVNLSHPIHIPSTSHESYLQDGAAPGASDPEVDWKTHHMGGKRTAGSDCTEAPLWDYVKPYFRCTGSQVAVHKTLTSDDDCHEEALDWLDTLKRHAAKAQEEDRGPESLFEEGHPVEEALGFLEEEKTSDLELGPVRLDELTKFHGRDGFGTVIDPAISVLSCIDAQPTSGVPDWQAVLDNILDTVDELVGNATPQNATHTWVNVTEELNPVLADEGEPSYRVEPRIDANANINVDLREALATNSSHNVTVAIDEWTTELASGELVIQSEKNNGSTTHEVRSTYNASDVDTTFTENQSINPEHGEEFELNLSVEDAYGLNRSHELVFTADVKDPQIDPDLSTETFTNLGSLQAAWILEDPASGLHEVDVTTQPPDLATNITLNESEEGTTQPLTVETTVDLNDSTTGDTVNVTLTVEDKAGNTNTTWHNIAVDREPPLLGGGITNDRHHGTDNVVNQSQLNVTWDLEDPGPANFTNFTVNLYNASRQTNHTLAYANTAEDLGQVDGNKTPKPAPNTTYTLYLEAKDAAGNTNLTRADQVDVQIIPAFLLRAPHWKQQLINDVAPHRLLDLTLPDYGIPVEEVTVNVTNETTTFFEHAWQDEQGTLTEAWNASQDQAPNGTTYVVEAFARHGRAALNVTLPVERGEPNNHGYRSLTQQYNNDTDVERGVMYGQLNGSTDQDTFIAAFQNCQTDETTGITLTLEGFTHDVTLHTAEGAPSGSTTNWTNDTTSGTQAQVQRSTSESELDFTVIAAANTTATVPYELRYNTDCDSTTSSDDTGSYDDDDSETVILPNDIN